MIAAKKSNSKLIVNILSISLILLIIIIFLCDPARYKTSVFNGLIVFATVILPVALPFFLFSKLLLELGAAQALSKMLSPWTRKVYGCNGITAYIFIMSILSGYPVGAKLIAELRQSGQLSDTEAKKAVTFCSTSGPMFIVGSLGAGIFCSVKLGIILFAGHLLAALINGLFYFYIREKNTSDVIMPGFLQKSPDQILSESIYSTVISLLTVGTYIALFYMLGDIILATGIGKPAQKLLEFLLKGFGGQIYAAPLFAGILEMTRGCIDIAALNLPVNAVSVGLLAFMISWGGLSVHLQNLSFLAGAKIKAGFYFLSKTTQGLLAVAITVPLWMIF